MIPKRASARQVTTFQTLGPHGWVIGGPGFCLHYYSRGRALYYIIKQPRNLVMGLRC